MNYGVKLSIAKEVYELLMIKNIALCEGQGRDRCIVPCREVVIDVDSQVQLSEGMSKVSSDVPSASQNGYPLRVVGV